MTRKTLIMVASLAFLGVFFAAGLLMAADPPETVEIYNEDVFGKMKKGAVSFSHQKHGTDYGVKCADCHHVYDGDNNTWKEGDAVQKCSECHEKKKTETDDGKRVYKLQNAYHKNCKDCHKDQGKGPFKKCDECHADK